MMNSDQLGADFSHIWDFLNDNSNVDGHNLVTDDLQPQSSSSCSSSSSSSISNNYRNSNNNKFANNNQANSSNYSYTFINSTMTENSSPQKAALLNKNSRLITDTGGSGGGRGPGTDFNSMLFTSTSNTSDQQPQQRVQHDPLSFLNFTEAPQALPDTGNIIDDFLIDFRQPDSTNNDSQFANICNQNQSQILTPPGSASSATSHIIEPTSNIEQFPSKYQNNPSLTPLTITEQIKLINSPTKPAKTNISPKKTTKTKTQKIKVEQQQQLLSPATIDPNQIKAASNQSSFLTPSPSSCSSSSPCSTNTNPATSSYPTATSSHISPVQQAVNILAPPPPKSYILTGIDQQQQQPDNLMLFISDNNDSNGICHQAMHSSSSSASNAGKSFFLFIIDTHFLLTSNLLIRQHRHIIKTSR